MLKTFRHIIFIAGIFLFAGSCQNIFSERSSEETTNSKIIDSTSHFAVKGVGLVATVNEIDTNAFLEIRNINANAIAIMPYGFCSEEQPVVAYNSPRQWWGEKDIGVATCIKIAREKNLAVMVKPHLWIRDGQYSGQFDLANDDAWKLWEDGYLNYIIHFAKIADTAGADIFCIGTELGNSIKERPVFWDRLIDSVRQVFHGKLTYAANWDDYDDVPFWKKLDYIGIDAYFPLSGSNTPSTDQLAKGWRKYLPPLEKIAKENNRRVLFTEYGYRNSNACAAEPWKENGNDANDVAQANAYEAFYESFSNKNWFAGGFVWKWYAEHYFHKKNKVDFTPQGKPAANVIERWYRQSR
ncbi:MAG: hypothetical protein ABI683_10425 [Ginsengibacter sp.]